MIERRPSRIELSAKEQKKLLRLLDNTTAMPYTDMLQSGSISDESETKVQAVSSQQYELAVPYTLANNNSRAKHLGLCDFEPLSVFQSCQDRLRRSLPRESFATSEETDGNLQKHSIC